MEGGREGGPEGVDTNKHHAVTLTSHTVLEVDQGREERFQHPDIALEAGSIGCAYSTYS